MTRSPLKTELGVSRTKIKERKERGIEKNKAINNDKEVI